MVQAAFQELKHTYKCFLGLLAMKFKLPIYILCFRIILFSIYIMPQINFMTLSPKGHFPKPLMFTLLINVSLKQHTRELRTDQSLNKTSPSQYSLLIQSGQPILELQTKVGRRFAKISQSQRIPLLEHCKPECAIVACAVAANKLQLIPTKLGENQLHLVRCYKQKLLT